MLQRLLNCLDPELRGARVRCVVCRKPLSYYYGSIMWESIDRHLCPSCAGKEAGKRAAEVFRKALNASPARTEGADDA